MNISKIGQNSKLDKIVDKTKNWTKFKTGQNSKLDKNVDKINNLKKLWTKLIIGKNCGQN